MKIKVGQWVRLNNSQLEYVDYLVNDMNNHYYVLYTSTISKVADTPQELIEVGDLVFSSNEVVMEVKKTSSILFYSTGYTVGFRKDKIIKILTPNSKGGYDLQWEANNE